VLVQFDQRHRRSAGFGNVKFRTVADAQRAVAMAAASEPEGGLVIDGAAVTVVPSQVKMKSNRFFGCMSGLMSVCVCVRDAYGIVGWPFVFCCLLQNIQTISTKHQFLVFSQNY
jgi:hypothetical protein